MRSFGLSGIQTTDESEASSARLAVTSQGLQARRALSQVAHEPPHGHLLVRTRPRGSLTRQAPLGNVPYVSAAQMSVWEPVCLSIVTRPSG